MKISSFLPLAAFGLKTILFKKSDPILGTIIVTDRCNLHCKHCSVNNITSVLYPYTQIRREMEQLYSMGIRILFFCGGETFLWRDGDITLRDLVIEAKRMGFLIVNVVTNGTFPLDLPEADLILLSLDGDRERHNTVRGDTYDLIMENIKNASSDNICFYMAINQINKDAVRHVCRTARDTKNVRAVSFNFHTPYPDTRELALSRDEKASCCRVIEEMMEESVPVFNLKSAFPYLIDGSFPPPLPPMCGHGKRDSLHLRPLHLCPGPVQPVRLFLCGRIHPDLPGKAPDRPGHAENVSEIYLGAAYI